MRRVLPEGDEVHVLTLQKRRDALRGAGETVVCGNGENERRAVSQMRLARHCDGGIRDAAGELCERIARARRDEHGIGKTLRADGFRFCDGVDNFSSADIFYALVKAFRRAEACIGRVRRFAHHGQHIPVLSQQSKLRESFFKCAERSAHGKGKRGHVDHYSSKIL